MHSDTNRRLTGGTLALLTGAVLSMACSSNGDQEYQELNDSGSGGGSNAASGNDATAAVTSGGNTGGASSNGTNASNVGATSTGFIDITTQQPDPVDDVPCAASNTPTVLQDIVLAFVFDVSASMGNGQNAYFSRELKWDPVVAATKAFFEDPNSKGLAATLTFFPNANAPIAGGPGMPGGNGASNGAECVAEDYATADVPLTDLPSAAFSQAIDAVTPPDDNTWRLGTPTLPAYEGTVLAIQAMQAANPAAKYSIVVVTDGMPALCPGIADDIGPVAQAAAAVAADIPTYVIGVENPVTDEDPNPPDTVSALNDLAVAGGTDMAYLINTDDPTQTTTQLKEIIETIREFNISCSLAIPQPEPGETFDQNKVNVGYSSPSLGDIPFDYDPTCTAPNAWHYDDEANPTSIEICDQVCGAIRVQQDEGELTIALGCERREPA